MPSPFLMAAFVVKGNTLPQPPVQRMTARAVIASISAGLAGRCATTPCTRPSSTRSLVTNHSSYRTTLGYLREVWNSVWSMWKPVLSAANHVRIFFMPPNGRTAIRPSASRLHGTAPVLEAEELLAALP